MRSCAGGTELGHEVQAGAEALQGFRKGRECRGCSAWGGSCRLVISWRSRRRRQRRRCCHTSRAQTPLTPARAPRPQALRRSAAWGRVARGEPAQPARLSRPRGGRGTAQALAGGSAQPYLRLGAPAPAAPPPGWKPRPTGRRWQAPGRRGLRGGGEAWKSWTSLSMTGWACSGHAAGGRQAAAAAAPGAHGSPLPAGAQRPPRCGAHAR